MPLGAELTESVSPQQSLAKLQERFHLDQSIGRSEPDLRASPASSHLSLSRQTLDAGSQTSISGEVSRARPPGCRPQGGSASPGMSVLLGPVTAQQLEGSGGPACLRNECLTSFTSRRVQPGAKEGKRGSGARGGN